MIKVKHFMDAAEADDGERIWVEAIPLAKDFCEWCAVDHDLSHLGPPRELANWFEEHQDGWEFFRGKYHECLSHSPYRPALQRLACVARGKNLTLLHHGDDPQHNSAAALHEFISELEAYCPPE